MNGKQIFGLLKEHGFYNIHSTAGHTAGANGAFRSDKHDLIYFRLVDSHAHVVGLAFSGDGVSIELYNVDGSIMRQKGLTPHSWGIDLETEAPLYRDQQVEVLKTYPKPRQ